jgi:endoglucanase
MISHPKLRRALERVAQEHDITYNLEVLHLGSTDAAALQASRACVMAGAVSIPTRYTHLTAEMMDMDDVAGAVRLLTAYLADPDPANGA